ncbi:hypothetical protein [Streptomyces cadmiisoli]|uniref:Lipoprotein n=1 Tax=Streptomyces cadmiisoli TaxID=2184053 RepID=A0A2Z4J300_9ACTN|nr:hypothetical protein [Streptomyces cadmiisoli]AWW39088.1 hypothetical protein DN051_22525 [Streptomyces cadmiisoli]
MKGSRVTALLAGLAAALTPAACGVPPSDVIEAGEPASGMRAPGPTPSVPSAVSLYFLSDGVPTPYPRKIGDPADLGAVVSLLFAGPTDGEAGTAVTELPHLTDAPGVTAGSGGISVKLPDDVAPLSRPAMLQLACTVAHAGGASAGLPAGGAVAAPSVDAQGPDGQGSDAQRSAAHTNVHVFGDGWAKTQSTASCPDPARP